MATLVNPLVRAVKAQVGNVAYSQLENAAEREVALAKGVSLVDAHGVDTYYRQRFLLGELLPVCESFERAGLKVLPTEVVNVLFRCKLLFASKSDQEFAQRSGGVPLLGEFDTTVTWGERTDPIDVVIDRHMSRLQDGIRERTLLTQVSAFDSVGPIANAGAFFEGLFARLGLPFVCYFEGDHLIEAHRRLEPGLRTYDLVRAERYFSAPSMGYRTLGSRAYCFWNSTMWLRTFLNLLRIATYIHPAQRDFGRDVKMDAPGYPVFLGEHARGALQWNEDAKESWAKIPDGCLFLSFGYRGLSNVWLDLRTFPHIERFLLDHRVIFECLRNPWDARMIRDVAPTLDILSSAAQIPDLGAKILLTYCCLEHLFVPREASGENKKYIVGGMNALGPKLLPWFYRLYDLRCRYAHKGFVLKDETTMALVAESMNNAITLLSAKLSVP